MGPAPDEDADGYTVYARGELRLEVAFLARSDDGEAYTPTRQGRGTWPGGSFGEDRATLGDVRARVVSLDSLRTDKSETRADATVAEKDRADVAALAALD